MALRSLSEEVSELCIGKPELKWIAAKKTSVADALRALKACGDTCISVWMCGGDGTCECVGKICMADVILFLCRDKNLADPSTALQTPLYEILPKLSPTVRHAQPNCSVFKAIDYLHEGTQNLIIPIQNRHNNTRKRFPNMKPSHSCHKPHQYCWLTQEHVLRFLLNSIRAFSPVYSFTIDSLNVIDCHIMTVTYNQPAHSALAYFEQAITEQKSVAVVDEENRLIGEISPVALAYSDETAASAIMALSAMDFMTYINCSSPPENLVSLVKTRLEEMKLGGMADMMDESTHSSLLSSSCSSSSSLSSCSSDDESVSICRRGSRRHSRCEAVVCNRESSLLSVMLRVISHHVSCVWVVEEDYAVVGAVTCSGILNVFRSVACKAWMDGVF